MDEETAHRADLPQWWCDDTGTLIDHVDLTLQLARLGELSPAGPGGYVLWTQGTMAVIQVYDKGVEVITPLVFDVPDDEAGRQAMQVLNRCNPAMKYWLDEERTMLGSVRVSAQPFIGDHLVEAIRLCSDAVSTTPAIAAACGGRPAT